MYLKIIKNLITFVLCLYISGCGQQTNETSSLPISINEPNSLTDSLMTVYGNIITAVKNDDIKSFYNYLDPEKTKQFISGINKFNPRNLASDINRKISSWPALDTLQIYEIKQNENYIRLSFTGMPYYSRYDDQRIRYTFLLFKKINNQWRLSTISSFDKELYGLYGYVTTYHETDLPSGLRFPRMF